MNYKENKQINTIKNKEINIDGKINRKNDWEIKMWRQEPLLQTIIPGRFQEWIFEKSSESATTTKNDMSEWKVLKYYIGE